MSETRSPPEQHASFQTGVNVGSASNLRQRPLGRATTFSESRPSFSKLRRNSVLSDTVSEARQSIRDSTDDLLFPRAKAGPRGATRVTESNHDSHWQSAPLALALLPAVGGLFFHDGSAFVTDATLLILAAIFLNWSVRLPWNWYRSAQEVRQPPPETILSDSGVIVEEDNEEGDSNSTSHASKQAERKELEHTSQAAMRELHMHELAALISCFVFPLIGAWLLHAVRGALSRPSEGLVSNYNLTIFLLAAEIRPFAHLLRMVQGRTLYLQRVVAAASDEDDEDGRMDHNKILDFAIRLEDLEAYVANKVETAATNSASALDGASEPQSMKQERVAQIIAEVRQSFQPEFEALNRAVRRYEKRTATMAFQIDTRMNQIEAQAGDAIALAAAAQRSANDNRHSLVGILSDWAYATVVIPVKMINYLASMPGRAASFCLQNIIALLMTGKARRKAKGKQSQAQPPSSRSERRYMATHSSQGSAA
ncbi:hypothetical protein UA08_07022 [Talaromyces atroroseus]|uniref:Uncharacterized protein n=1 Tax=Talaromyces atroroseus TaxID=1441469 RepID=A0A225ATQ7_TALAT|nr:hypothetical protein UA08_07022 [Talaromyces atroroseus]OKL57795.1 hypothetical protein UA08_07022 [Talaromyces atroroseus]